MNNQTIFRKTLLAVGIAAGLTMLAACSSSSDSSDASGSTTVGVITGFGSIYVNGVEYETDTASIDIDGAQSIETSLGIGDVCELHGTINTDGLTGTVTSVSCADELEGYVLDVSGLVDGLGTINVMGQNVTITLDTTFEGDGVMTIADLALNDIVEVSGFSDGNGNILATRVETKDMDDDVEVKGLIQNLDTAAFTFTLGSLTVDYSSATEVEANLANDLFVEVKTEVALNGDLTSGFVMIASKVEIEEDGDMDLDGDEGEEIEAQGIVSDVTDSSFRFNGQLIEFDSLDMDDDDDFDPASLVGGMTITVEGHFDANGNFVIKEIEEMQGSENESEGLVTAKTDDTVTIGELTVRITNETRMKDERDEDGMTPLHRFSLADVAIGDFIEIEYYVDETSGENVATELERDDAPAVVVVNPGV